jgi:hypothetical protein
VESIPPACEACRAGTTNRECQTSPPGWESIPGHLKKVYKYGLCLPGIIEIISQQMILKFLRFFIFPNLRFAIFNQILKIHKLIHFVFFYWIKGAYANFYESYFPLKFKIIWILNRYCSLKVCYRKALRNAMTP